MLIFGCGSPPRLWGIRPRPRPWPACSSVHPHACGEYGGGGGGGPAGRFTPTPVGNTASALSAPRPIAGSPPRLWGIRIGCRSPRSPTTVHPHACGEYSPSPSLLFSSFGSPPRLWGIPTRKADREALKDGSPPRLWGIRKAKGPRFLAGRFTPTPVGNTFMTAALAIPMYGSPPRLWGIRGLNLSQTALDAVHPHACGEYQCRVGAGRRDGRFTPTPVGNTGAFLPTRAPLPVHPHACGEYVVEAV